MLQLLQYENNFIISCTCSTCTSCSTQLRRSQPLRIRDLSAGARSDGSCCISRSSADMLQPLYFKDNFIISCTWSTCASCSTEPRRSQPLKIKDLSAGARCDSSCCISRSSADMLQPLHFKDNVIISCIWNTCTSCST